MFDSILPTSERGLHNLAFPKFTHAIKNLCAAFFIFCTAEIHAAEKNDLASSAMRYGELMSAHWMLADLAQQIERANFYRTNLFAAELNPLQQSISESEEQLDKALALYKKIYKKQV